MADLNFSQPERRSYLVPVLVALLILGIAGGFLYRTYSRRVVIAAVTHTTVHPIHVVYTKQAQTGSFKVLGGPTGESDLYLVPNIRIENHLTVPLFLKDFTITMTVADGELHTSAIEKNDLDVVYASFPEIKGLMTKPLLRDAEIAPGATVEGTLLAQFAIPQNVWDQRQSATLTIDLYHQNSMTIPIPKP